MIFAIVSLNCSSFSILISISLKSTNFFLISSSSCFDIPSSGFADGLFSEIFLISSSISSGRFCVSLISLRAGLIILSIVSCSFLPRNQNQNLFVGFHFAFLALSRSLNGYTSPFIYTIGLSPNLVLNSLISALCEPSCSLGDRALLAPLEQDGLVMLDQNLESVVLCHEFVVNVGGFGCTLGKPLGCFG